MLMSRFTRILFCSAMLLAASIVPASSKTPAASHRASRTVPHGAKATSCYDYGSFYRCCTDNGFCCTWSGSGSPTCRSAP